MSGSLQLCHTVSNGTGVKKNVTHSSLGVTLWGQRNLIWMMSEAQSTPHGRSPSPHLAQKVCAAIPVSEDTVCGSTCSQNQCQVTSCLQQGCQWQPKENYIQGLEGTHLSLQLRCPFHRNLHKDCG